jgi:2-oxo-4-hydroxy-4-carboxy-5-ureidoimidazoline decarboxylase
VTTGPPVGDQQPSGLTPFNEAPDADAQTALTAVCASPRWVREVAAARPYASLDDLVAHAAKVVLDLDEAELDAAIAAHPRIGARGAATSEESRREQSGVADADADVLMDIVDGNRAYEERFGHVYLVRATGRTAEELLALLRERLDNDPETERAVVRRELAEINALRLQRLVQDADFA